MPKYQIELSDGRKFVVEADGPPSEQDVLAAIGSKGASAPERFTDEQGSGGATAAALAARAVPSMVKGVARVAANHPAAAQKVIGAGISTAAGGIGATVGGVPGAVVGASIRGVTPAQTTIRQVAGQWAGETPAVAQNAARALGIQNYGKAETGVKVLASDIISKPNAANALEHYANAQERGILRLYGPSGEVVSGPEAITRVPSRAVPGAVTKSVGALRTGLGLLSAATGATDFAQAVEPTRRDIGVMGIGANVPRSDEEQAAHPAMLNALRDYLLKAMRGANYEQVAP